MCVGVCADVPEPEEGSEEQLDPVPLMDRSCVANVLEKVIHVRSCRFLGAIMCLAPWRRSASQHACCKSSCCLRVQLWDVPASPAFCSLPRFQLAFSVCCFPLQRRLWGAWGMGASIVCRHQRTWHLASRAVACSSQVLEYLKKHHEFDKTSASQEDR